MPRTRAGIDLLENSGANTNSGEMRARTAKKPTTCCSPNWAMSCWTVTCVSR